MTYLLLCALFLGIALAAAGLLRRAARRRGGDPVSVRATALAAIVLMVLTAVFDNVMIAAGLFAYDDAHISGIRIGAAPIEDFAYPLAAAILLPAVWSWRESRAKEKT